jgi:CubicO group peptidase (beta-lactamase class C family)
MILLKTKHWIFFLSKLYLLLVLFVGMQACQGNDGNKKMANATATTLIPLSDSLSSAEKRKLQQACQLWYDTMLGTRGFNGGMVVAYKGNIVFEKYNGHEQLDSTGIAINDSTALHIASVSKTFTGMAVLKLQEAGKLNIDDELVKYFPAFNYAGVTIRSLLNHRSGLPNYTHFIPQQPVPKAAYLSNADILNILISKKAELPPAYRPNTKFAYCNTNYALLALLIEKVAQVKYSSFIDSVFFKPIGMRHSFVYDTAMASKVVMSYDWRGRLQPHTNLDAVYGDKNIYTTPRDLLLWDKALRGGKLFSQATLDAAYTPYSNERPGIRNYGLGWRMNCYPNGNKMIFHNGWWHGNNAAFVRLLQDSATIIVLGNKQCRNIYYARDLTGIFGEYIGGEEEEEANGNKPTVDTATKAKTAPAKKAKVPGNSKKRRQKK